MTEFKSSNERLGITPTAGVLIFNDTKDKVLLVKHGDSSGHLNDTYGIPAGTVEEDEMNDFSITARREGSEETGLTIDKIHPNYRKVYFGEIPRKVGGKQWFLVEVYICTSFSGSLEASKEGKVEWVPIVELSNYELLLNMTSIIEDGIAFLQNE